MFVLVVNIRIKPENVERWTKMALENAREARKEPGCRQFDVLVDPKDKTKVMLYEIYNDEQAFEAHQQTPHFKKYLARRCHSSPRASAGVHASRAVKLAYALLLVAAQALAQSYPTKAVKVMVACRPAARRHRGARGGPGSRRGARPAGDNREPPGRERDHRQRAGGEGAARRPHARLYLHHARHQSDAESRSCPTTRCAISRRCRWSGSSRWCCSRTPSFPASTVQELIAAAKANPGKIDYGASDAAARHTSPPSSSR